MCLLLKVSNWSRQGPHCYSGRPPNATRDKRVCSVINCVRKLKGQSHDFVVWGIVCVCVCGGGVVMGGGGTNLKT